MATNLETDVIFDTLSQYATDTSAGAAVAAAVASVVGRGDFDRTRIVMQEAKKKLRWLADQKQGVQEQIFALAFGVKKFYQETERKKMRDYPARMTLDYLKIAVAVYRALQKKPALARDVVRNTQIKTRAAYMAIVRINLYLIHEMRNRKEPWVKISKALSALSNTKIPPSVLPSLVREAEEERARQPAPPSIMTHWTNEEISAETWEAYRQAGYAEIPAATEQANEQ